jgi:hypothetical protein
VILTAETELERDLLWRRAKALAYLLGPGLRMDCGSDNATLSPDACQGQLRFILDSQHSPER